MVAAVLMGLSAAALQTTQAVGVLQTTQIPDGVVGQAYSTQLQGTGTAPLFFEKWYLTHPGTSMNLSSNGVFSGIPTQAGTYELGVRVSDNTGSGTYSVLTWKVNATGTGTTGAPIITAIQGFDPNANPQYTNSQATSGTYAVLYGTFAASGNQLISTGSVSGTISYQSTGQINILLANNTGTATFAISNTNGTSASRSIAVVTPGTITAGTLSLANDTAVRGVSIPAGSPNYPLAGFRLTTGNTPVTITSLVVLSDSPSRSQLTNIRVLKDGVQFVGNTAATLETANAGINQSTITFSPAVTIPANTTTLLEVSASVGSAATGNLRVGLGQIMSGATVVSTNPATPFYGPSFTITGTSTQNLTISTPDQLQDGMVGNAYSISLSASGGTAPYTWSVLPGQYNTYPCCYTQLNSNGTLVSVNNGSIMPFSGTYQVPVKVTDATGASAQKVFTWIVRPSTTPTPTPTPTPTYRVAEGYVDTLGTTVISGWAYTNQPSSGQVPMITIIYENVNTGLTNGMSLYPSIVRSDVSTYLQNKYGVNAYNVPTGFTANPSSSIGQSGTYRIRSATFEGTALVLSDAAKRTFTVGQSTGNVGPVSKYVRVDGDSTVYWVTSWGAKMPILSAQIFFSYGGRWEDVVIISQEALDAYGDVEYIKVSNNARVYKIEGSVKRYVTPAAATRLNIDPAKVVTVNQTEFVAYRTGSTIQ